MLGSSGNIFIVRRAEKHLGFVKRLFEEKFQKVLKEAKEYEIKCVSGEIWDGNAVLMVVDAALTSIGINYFKLVVPLVEKFHVQYVKTGQIISFENLSKLSPEDGRLRGIINNKRAWSVGINICKELNKIREDNKLSSDFDALKIWAEKANYEKWREDMIGKIKGVGLTTFQYLRLQAGMNTTVPDRMIRSVAEKEFSIKATDSIDFIKKMESYSTEVGFSQILFCWAAWLK